jgi:hypothetical protein
MGHCELGKPRDMTTRRTGDVTRSCEVTQGLCREYSRSGREVAIVAVGASPLIEAEAKHRTVLLALRRVALARRWVSWRHGSYGEQQKMAGSREVMAMSRGALPLDGKSRADSTTRSESPWQYH